ncbi:MAG: ATP phosphoribosyltransferase regulatory subunit [Myxococcales bacterium]
MPAARPAASIADDGTAGPPVESRAPLAAGPPPGTQDLLFEAARRLRRCEAALALRFEQSGFAEVIPPSLERAEVFEAASPLGNRDAATSSPGQGSGALRAVDRSGHLLALRADFTAQVARIAATRLAGVSPLRLYYRGSVVREAASGAGELREKLQAGCELVGEGGPGADAEMLALAGASLHALGIPGGSARLSVGTVADFDALLRAAGVGGRLARALSDAVDRKDLPTLTRLCGREVAPGKPREALLLLARPPAPHAGAAALLAQARAAAPTAAALEALDRLEATLGDARARGVSSELEVDLGEVRGLGYYTGLVFNLYVEGAARAVGGGGRYDTLLGRFGDPRPAVGFSLDLDALVPLARPGQDGAPC